jgi:hypothetical protein
MSKAWQEISLQLQRQNTTLGSTVNIQGILQDSYTSEFIIGVEGTISTAAATAAVEGLPAILQKVNINGPLSGYAPLTPINGLSGPMLAEAAQFIRSNVSYSFGALGSTGKFGVYIPCTFTFPRLPAPWSRMSVLPTNLMGAVNFNVLVASQAQIDTNATPTIAFSTLTIFVQQNEYKSSTIPPLSPLVPAANVPSGSQQFVPSSLNYTQNSSIQTSNQTQQQFPNGTYTMLLLRSFSTTSSGVATVRQSDTAAGGPIDVSVTTSGLILQDVNQTPKIAANWYTLRKDNLDNITDSLMTGNACFQFNHGVSRIFQPVIGPNQIPLNYGTTTAGTTNPRIDFVYQQIFDPMNWLGLV